MNIRRYCPKDCAPILELFFQTVHHVNRKDYTQEEVDAWADGKADEKRWNELFLQHESFVAEQDGVIVGFGDIDKSGYLDKLYVHKDFQQKGVATAICNKLESCCKLPITVHASITAKSFFEHRGYQIVKKQQVERHGISLTNYIMEKR